VGLARFQRTDPLPDWFTLVEGKAYVLGHLVNPKRGVTNDILQTKFTSFTRQFPNCAPQALLVRTELVGPLVYEGLLEFAVKVDSLYGPLLWVSCENFELTDHVGVGHDLHCLIVPRLADPGFSFLERRTGDSGIADLWLPVVRDIIR
jgi:hypothetical protein